MLRPLGLLAAVCALAALDLPVTAATAELPKNKDGVRPPLPTMQVAGETVGRDMQSLAWQMPKDLAAGWYRVEFTGTAIVPPFEWVSECEFEPYRFRLGTAPKGEEAPVAAFTCEVEGAVRTPVAECLHGAFRTPYQATLRRADRPLRLEPGMRVELETRWYRLMAGGLRLTPLSGAIADVATSSPVAYHLFDETQPPLFDIALSNRGEAALTGTLDLSWIDGLAGEVHRETRPVSVAAGASVSERATWPKPAFGAFSLHVRLRDAAGVLITHQQRHGTYSSRVDARELPDSWPFAWHIRGERMIPPVGFKWLRMFEGWNEIERKPGEYGWDRFDRNMALAKAGGHPVLWVLDGCPKHLSSKPQGGETIAGRKRTVGPGQFPPADWASVQTFVGAVLDRYAPGGDTSTLRAIEVLNEPMAFITYTGAEYTELCRRVHETAKAKSKDIALVGISECGGIHMGWINQVLDAGAAQWFDIASLHLYEASDPDRVTGKSRLLREALDKRGFAAMRMWNTEVGASSWGRWGGTIDSEDAMERRVREAPGFDPAVPYKLGGRWRANNEFVASCDMVRSAAQELAQGWADKIFLFKWRATNSSFINDGEGGGNVVPKLMLPVHSVLAQVWRRYAGTTAEDLAITSPHKAYKVFAHRFTGPGGRVTVLYAQPRRGSFVSGDETVADAGSDPLPEPPVEEETNALPGGLPTSTAPAVAKPGAWTPLPAYDQPVLSVALPGLRPDAVAMDILARRHVAVDAAQVPVSRAPVYIIEAADGRPWPRR